MKSISPAELQSLLTSDVDIVDVREPAEWAGGHVPSARLVPLSLLRADPIGALPRDFVIFVCAQGGRSAEAAALAEQIGRKEDATKPAAMDRSHGRLGCSFEGPKGRHTCAPEDSDDALACLRQW